MCSARHCCTLGLGHPAGQWGRQLPPCLKGLLGTGDKIQAEANTMNYKVRGLPFTACSSSPQGHPFIVQFNDGNAAVVSMWVCRALEERRSQQGPP